MIEIFRTVNINHPDTLNSIPEKEATTRRINMSPASNAGISPDDYFCLFTFIVII